MCWITGGVSLCTVCWSRKKKVKPGQQALISWLDLCCRGLGWFEGSCWSASLLVFGFSKFGIWDCQCCHGSRSSLNSEASQSDPTFHYWPSVMSLTRAVVLETHWSAGLILLPDFCLIAWPFGIIPGLSVPPTSRSASVLERDRSQKPPFDFQFSLCQ